MLTRTRFHRVATFALCLTPIWLNLIEGLSRPEGPAWYALLPMAAILGAAFLQFRAAALMAILGVLSALLVVVVHSDAVSTDRATLIVMAIGLMNTAALGMAAFRASVERARRQELERLAGQLAATERLESVGRLAGGIAHDFNNLLTVIISSAEVARAGQLDALDDLMSAAERAAALTHQLLAFSHHRGGQSISVPVDDAIETVRPLLRRLLPENIELDLELGARASVLLEDQQLEQILFNLSANARDAMRSGGRLTIKTTLESVPTGAPKPRVPGEFVVVEVIDNGVGMDANTRAHVFEPFFTTKPLGQGTGLGMATVYAIARKAGGWMELDSAPGQGARIRLALPTAPAQAAAVVSPAGARRSLSGCVLVVEDEPLVRRAISRVLTELGLSVLTACDADEAAQVLAGISEPLALLVTDVVMPGRSGVQLVMEVRATRPTLPVLFVSGYADEDLQGLLNQPATRFVAKPFTKGVLAEAVTTLMDVSEARPDDDTVAPQT